MAWTQALAPRGHGASGWPNALGAVLLGSRARAKDLSKAAGFFWMGPRAVFIG